MSARLLDFNAHPFVKFVGKKLEDMDRKILIMSILLAVFALLAALATVLAIYAIVKDDNSSSDRPAMDKQTSNVNNNQSSKPTTTQTGMFSCKVQWEMVHGSLHNNSIELWWTESHK